MTDKTITVSMTRTEAKVVAEALFASAHENLRKAGLQGNDMYDRAWGIYSQRIVMMLRLLEEAGFEQTARDYRIALTSLRKEREYEQN